MPSYRVFIGAWIRLLLFFCWVTPTLAQSQRSTAPPNTSFTPPSTQERPGLRQSITIPFVYDALLAPRIVVKVSINGQAPLPFVLDTGATSQIVLADWTPRALGLPIENIRGNLNNRLVPMTSVDRFFIEGHLQSGQKSGPIHFLNPSQVMVEDFSFWDNIFDSQQLGGQRIAGMIGMGWLRNYPCRFDFSAKTLTLLSADELEAITVKKPKRVPLQANGNLFFVRVNAKGLEDADVLVDTGVDTSRLQTSTVKNVNDMKVLSAMKFIAQSQGTTYLADRVLIKDFIWGGIHESRARVLLAQGAAGEYGVLGLTVLSRYKLTFDFDTSALYVEDDKRNVGTQPEQPDIYLWRDTGDGSYYVAALSPNAERGRVQINDKIVRVDGLTLAQYSPVVAQTLVGGFVRTPITLELERGDKKLKTRFARSEWHSTPGCGYGVLLKHTALASDAPNGLAVAEVIAGSPLEKFQIQPNDVLVELNGQRELNLSEVGGQLTAPKGTFVFWRRAEKAETTFSVVP